MCIKQAFEINLIMVRVKNIWLLCIFTALLIFHVIYYKTEQTVNNLVVSLWKIWLFFVWSRLVAIVPNQGSIWKNLNKIFQKPKFKLLLSKQLHRRYL